VKRASIIIIACILIGMSYQTSCAQSNVCPASNEKAEEKLKEYLSKERNIKSLGDNYGINITKNYTSQIKPLTGKENNKECQQLHSNLDWLENEENYSIYGLADHYFIIIYSFDEVGKFQFDSIPIINSSYKAVGSVINFEGS
jgi:hypothetical protein